MLRLERSGQIKIRLMADLNDDDALLMQGGIPEDPTGLPSAPVSNDIASQCETTSLAVRSQLDAETLHNMANQYDVLLKLEDAMGRELITWTEGNEKFLEIETMIPDLTGEVLIAFGIPKLEATIDEVKTSAFRKEGKIKAGGLFRIATDLNGHSVFLKRSYLWVDPPELETLKIYKLKGLRSMFMAEVASRVAHILGYPMLGTRLVIFEGIPCEAANYLEGAVDLYEQAARGRTIKNIEAKNVRPLFNLLIEAKGDSSFQGLLSEEGTYYAQDTFMNLTRVSISERDLKDSIKEEFVRSLDLGQDCPYGRIQHYSLIQDLTVTGFVDGLKRLINTDLSPWFKNYFGSENEKLNLQKGLRRRAIALIEILSEF